MPYPTGSGFHTRLCRDLWRCHKVGVGALDDPPPPQTPVHLRPRFRRARAARLCRSTSLRFAQNDTDGWALHTVMRRRRRQRGVEGAAPYETVTPRSFRRGDSRIACRLSRKPVGRGLAPAVCQRKADALPCGFCHLIANPFPLSKFLKVRKLLSRSFCVFFPQKFRFAQKVPEEKTIDNRFFKEVTETRRNETRLCRVRISTMFQEVGRRKNG